MLLLQTNAIADALNSSEWVFPITECFHIAAFAWSIGLIALVDFRLIGVGMKRESASEIARATAPWTLLGLAVVLDEVAQVVRDHVAADVVELDHALTCQV